jgi:excinuclease ABC subunit A
LRADRSGSHRPPCLLQHFAGPALLLSGTRQHNLPDIDLVGLLQRLVAETGVSGSGKSTMARDALLANVHPAVAVGFAKRT